MAPSRFSLSSIRKMVFKGHGSGLFLGTTTAGIGLEGNTRNFFKKEIDMYENDELVQSLIDLVASYATEKGFETKLVTLDGSDPERYDFVKDKIDEINRKINLDEVLNVAETKRQIYGRAGFEKVYDGDGFLSRTVPLRSEALIPQVDAELVRVERFRYGNSYFDPEDIIYFIRKQLEADTRGYLGVSKIRPVMYAVNTRREQMINLKHASLRQWAPFGVFQIDTSGLEPEAAAAKLEAFRNDLQPGSSIVTNLAVEAKVIDLEAKIDAINHSIQLLEEQIIGNWNVPKALMSREKSMNRATIEYSFKALVEGPVSSIQRYLRREVEKQIYDPTVELLGVDDKVKVLHKWKQITWIDFIEMSKALSMLKKEGLIDTVKAWELLGLDPAELETKMKKGTAQTRIASWIDTE